MKYVWWIENKKGGVGEYPTEKAAQTALVSLKSFLPDYPTQKTVRYEAEQCHCGRWTRKDIIENFGECLNCDHVAGEIAEDRLQESLENESKGYNNRTGE